MSTQTGLMKKTDLPGLRSSLKGILMKTKMKKTRKTASLKGAYSAR